MKKITLLIKILISALILFILFYKIGFGEVIKNLTNLNYFYLILAIGIFIINFVLVSLSLKLLLLPIKNIKLSNMLKYQILTYGISRFIPGRIGDFAIVYFLREEGLRIGEASAIVLIDRIATFFVTILISIIGLFIFFPLTDALRITFFLIISFIFFIVLINSNKGREIVKRYVLKKYAYIFEGFSKTFKTYSTKYFKYILLDILVTTIYMFSFGLFILFAFYTINSHTKVNLLITSTTNAIMEILSLIPITLSGLGIRESSAVIMYSRFGVEVITTMSVFTLLLIIRYLSAGIILIFWIWRNKIDIKKLRINLNDKNN